MSFTFKERRADENRRRFFNHLKVKPSLRVGLQAVHGSAVEKIDLLNKPKSPKNFDAAYTFTPGLFLFGTFADCLPIFFFSSKPGVVGLAHAGWRGVLAGIVPHIVEALLAESIDPAELFVAVGPHIQKRCFEVGEEVAELFSKKTSLRSRVFEEKVQPAIDLKGIVFDQLTGAGVLPEHIRLSDQCTHCDKIFFSNRRDRKKGAMLAFIGLSYFRA